MDDTNRQAEVLAIGELGRLVRERREQHRQSVRQAAQEVGVSFATLARVEPLVRERLPLAVLRLHAEVTMALAAASLVTLGIHRAVDGARMLARHEGQILFVSGAVPGERVLASVEVRAR